MIAKSDQQTLKNAIKTRISKGNRHDCGQKLTGQTGSTCRELMINARSPRQTALHFATKKLSKRVSSKGNRHDCGQKLTGQTGSTCRELMINARSPSQNSAPFCDEKAFETRSQQRKSARLWAEVNWSNPCKLRLTARIFVRLRLEGPSRPAAVRPAVWTWNFKSGVCH